MTVGFAEIVDASSMILISVERNEPMNMLTMKQSCKMQKIKCPRCGGDACQINYGKLTGTTIGILIGVTSTVLACFQKTKVSEDFVRLTNKALRSVIDHTLALLANVSTGGFIGQQAGDLVDENLIRSYRCVKCKLKFRI